MKIAIIGSGISGLTASYLLNRKHDITLFENNDYIGGNHITSLNLSATLPNIVQGLDNLDVGIFVDAANVWGVDYDSSIDDKSKLRSSTGVALNLMTPIGPLSFSFANALTKASTDKTETFRFNLGTQF